MLGRLWLSRPRYYHILHKATLTWTQKRRVTKETATRRKRKNRRNQALQCSQLLSPIMRMYSWGEGHTHGL